MRVQEGMTVKCRNVGVLPAGEVVLCYLSQDVLHRTVHSFYVHMKHLIVPADTVIRSK